MTAGLGISTAGTADSSPDRDVPPEFMASMYGWLSAGLIVCAFTARFLGGYPPMLTIVSHHRGLCTAVVIAQMFLGAGLSASVLDLEPAVASVAFIGASVNGGVAMTLIMASFASSFFAHVLVVAGAYILLAVYVGATGQNLDDLGPSAFIAGVGLLLSLLVGVGWRNDYLACLGMCAATLVVAVLTGFASAYLRLNMAARTPDKPPVNPSAAALAFSLACVMYILLAVPGQYGYSHRD